MSQVKIQGNASGTGVFTVASPNSNNTQTLTLPDATATLVGDTATQTLTNKTLTSPTITGASMSSMASSVITSGTAQNSTSGTSIDFTSIPSWVKRITVMFNGVSTNGTSLVQVQLGAGSIVTTGYASSGSVVATGVGSSSSTTGLLTNGGVSDSTSTVRYGLGILTLVGSNAWVWQCVLGDSSGALGRFAGGGITLGGTLDRVRITTVNGTDTFDAGSINILYE